MNMIKVVGIDIAKSVFQVCVWVVDGSVAWNRKISRQKLLHTMHQFPPQTLTAMEVCSTSHFWGRPLPMMPASLRWRWKRQVMLCAQSASLPDG